MTPYPHIVGKIEYTTSIYALFYRGWKGSFRELAQTNMYHINVEMPVDRLINDRHCIHYDLKVTDHTGTRVYTK